MSMTCECGSKFYPYTDGEHHVFVCFKCGKFEGISNDDPEFIDDITEDPILILELIQSKILVPMK